MTGLKDTLIFSERPPCKECLDQRDERHPMEPTQSWHAALACYVDCWECPGCDRVVVRGDDPAWVNPDGKEL